MSWRIFSLFQAIKMKHTDDFYSGLHHRKIKRTDDVYSGLRHRKTCLVSRTQTQNQETRLCCTFFIIRQLNYCLSCDCSFVVEKPVCFATVVEPKDVRMRELRRDVYLLKETIRTECRGQFGPKYLERHLAVELQVFGEVDRCHATATKFPLYGVAVGEGGFEIVE